MTKSVTRRNFLSLLGAYGGTSALLQAGTALGLMPGPAQAAELSLMNAKSDGRRVAVLGSGLSGLAVAWELTKAGDFGKYEKVDFDTVKFTLELPARSQKVFTYTTRKYQGKRKERR